MYPTTANIFFINLDGMIIGSVAAFCVLCCVIFSCYFFQKKKHQKVEVKSGAAHHVMNISSISMNSPIHEYGEEGKDEGLYNQQQPGANDTIGGGIMDKGEGSNGEMYEPYPTPETERFNGRQSAGDNSAMGEKDYQNMELNGQIIESDRGYKNANSNW